MKQPTKEVNLLSIDPKNLKSEVLKRLIAEVKNDIAAGNNINAYNRIHNRHNRSV